MSGQESKTNKHGGGILYNQEVPDDVRQQLEQGLDGVLPVDRTETKVELSATVPELVRILLEAAAWKQALGAAAILFLKEYIKRFGKRAADTHWDQGAALTSLLKEKSVASLKKVTEAITQTKRSLSPRSRIQIGLPFPHAKHGTLLTIETDDEQEIALILALFVDRTEEIESHLQEATNESGVLGAVILEINDEGNIEATWKDQALQKHTVTIQSSLSEDS